MTCRHAIVRLRIAPVALALLILGGCATPQLEQHREGVLLIQQGRLEDGLALLAEASRAEPGNLAFRAVLIRSREQAVGRLITAAASERAAERPDSAQILLERVLRIDPNNERARIGLDALAMDRRHAQVIVRAQALLAAGDIAGAMETLRPVLAENSRHGKALMLQRQLDSRLANELAASPRLKAPFRKPVTLQFRDANLKLVFEALSRVSGINVLLDKDVRTDIKTSIFAKDASVEDAIDLILLQNQLEKKVISDNTVFIYPSSPAKLREYQDLKVKSFHLVNADPKQMLAMIKTLLKTRDIFIHERTNSLIMKDTPEAIRLAEKLISDQDIADPEVMLEVEVMEVSRSRLSELGIRYPDSIGLSTPAGTGGALTLGQLRSLSSGDLLVSPLGVALNLRLQDGTTNVLASPRIRARNGEKAKILIGDRVPVITNSVTPLATGTPVVTGSVQYLDVGIKLEVEPSVHPDSEVGIRIGLEVSSIVREVSTPSGTLAYQIGSRSASTVLRLKDGETQVLAGLINDDERRTANKIPGLGDLPLLGRLFGSFGRNAVKSEVILSITPRIVGLPRLPDATELEYWAGTESGARTLPLTVAPRGAVSMTSTGGATSQPLRPVVPETPPPASALPPPLAPTPAPVPPPVSAPVQPPGVSSFPGSFPGQSPSLLPPQSPSQLAPAQPEPGRPPPAGQPVPGQQPITPPAQPLLPPSLLPEPPAGASSEPPVAPSAPAEPPDRTQPPMPDPTRPPPIRRRGSSAALEPGERSSQWLPYPTSAPRFS